MKNSNFEALPATPAHRLVRVGNTSLLALAGKSARSHAAAPAFAVARAPFLRRPTALRRKGGRRGGGRALSARRNVQAHSE